MAEVIQACQASNGNYIAGDVHINHFIDASCTGKMLLLSIPKLLNLWNCIV